MTILSMERRRGSLYCLSLDGGREVLLDRLLMEELPYQAGSDITEEELERLSACSAQLRARSYALYLLGLRDYGASELSRKLRDKGYGDVAADTVARLQEQGLLDDARYARQLARDCRRRRLFSRYRTVQELCAHGVSRETATWAVDEVDEEDHLDECEQALALLRKKRYTGEDDPTARRRGEQLLARYGYSYDVVRAAFRALGDAVCAEETDVF